MSKPSSRDLLNNILSGKALPRPASRAAVAVGVKSSAAEDRKRFNDALSAQGAAKLAAQPLLAVCLEHRCTCGHVWKEFGFYARKVRVQQAGIGAIEMTKRLDYDPRPEPVAETEWRIVSETVCVQCFGGSAESTAPAPKAAIGIASLIETVRYNRLAPSAAPSRVSAAPSAKAPIPHPPMTYQPMPAAESVSLRGRAPTASGPSSEPL